MTAIFQKKASEHDLCTIKPALLSLLSGIENDFSSDTFEVLNTLATEYKTLIVADLEILTKFVSIIFNLLKPAKNPLPELGKKWALRVLRWILVIDPEPSDLEELKKCYLMAVTSRQFYLTQLELGLERLTEQVLVYITVKDEKIISKLLEGYSEYFKLDPKLLYSKIKSSMNSIFEKLLESNLFPCLPDDFVSALVLEAGSHYYKELDVLFKKELCRVFEDVFLFEVLQVELESKKEYRWFLHWLAEDLGQFRRFCQFQEEARREKKDYWIFLEQVRLWIIEIGRKEGLHSLSSYERIFSIS